MDDHLGVNSDDGKVQVSFKLGCSKSCCGGQGVLIERQTGCP